MRAWLRLSAAVVATLAPAACQRIEPTRTLPTWVREVYIPIFENRSYEPHIEELATRLTQEAFLADGRLGVVSRERADLIVRVEILGWESDTAATSGGRIATRDRIAVNASVRLYESAEDRDPIADLGTIVVRSQFVTDTRANDFVPLPRRRASVLEILAQRIVDRTIGGYPQNLRNPPPGEMSDDALPLAQPDLDEEPMADQPLEPIQ
jgi:hypothetical protein